MGSWPSFLWIQSEHFELVQQIDTILEVWDKGRTHLGFSPKQQGVARGDELEKSIIGVPKEPIEDFSRIMHRYTHTQTHTHIQKTKTKTDQEPPGEEPSCQPCEAQGIGSGWCWLGIMWPNLICSHPLGFCTSGSMLHLTVELTLTIIRKRWFLFNSSPCTTSWQSMEYHAVIHREIAWLRA